MKKEEQLPCRAGCAAPAAESPKGNAKRPMATSGTATALLRHHLAAGGAWKSIGIDIIGHHITSYKGADGSTGELASGSAYRSGVTSTVSRTSGDTACPPPCPRVGTAVALGST